MGRLAVLAMSLGLLLAFAAAFCAWRYDQAMAIDSVKGINQSGYVRIGGIDQWVQIRGQDRSNPVLLWLNSGPGYSTLPQTLSHRDWEKLFTVVMWDQRGEGLTLDKSGPDIAPTMTIARMAEDGVALADYLRQRLGKQHIILMGHSWGSILGVEMVRRRPDLFSVYVGTGQVTRLRDDIATSYPRLVEQARLRGNRYAFEELQTAGPPPYSTPEKYFIPLKWANAFDPPLRRPLSPEGLWAMGKMVLAGRSAGPEFSQRLLLPAMLNDGLTAIRLDVPIVIIAGGKDLVTPRAKFFFDTVSAPHKEYIVLPGDGHLALFANPKGFLDVLDHRVRPFVHE